MAASSSDTNDEGPGTELHRILAKFGFRMKPGCGCRQHIREMNQRGWRWCEQNQETIVGWLQAEARRRRLPFSTLAARAMVRRAIHRAKKIRRSEAG